MKNFPKTPCGRCLETDETKIRESIKELLSLMPAEKRVSGDVYEARLQICADCENLVKGTCVKCGCYVELRAAKNHMNCPKKYWGKH